MAICWSAENATKAYIKTMKMVSPQIKHKQLKEPDVAEFVSALAAGNNAQLMVIAFAASDSGCSAAAGLVAAAHQTGGRVVCIFRSENEILDLSRNGLLGLDPAGRRVEFVSGDAKSLLTDEYKEADFIVVDCNLEEHEEILKEARSRCVRKKGSAIVLGYNALSGSSRTCGGAETQLLPIGGGLLLTRVAAGSRQLRDHRTNVNNGGSREKSHWVVKVDKCTGEEHVFRVRSPRSQGIRPIAC